MCSLSFRNQSARIETNISFSENSTRVDSVSFHQEEEDNGLYSTIEDVGLESRLPQPIVRDASSMTPQSPAHDEGTCLPNTNKAPNLDLNSSTLSTIDKASDYEQPITFEREGGAFINQSENYHHLYNRLDNTTTTSSVTMTTGQDKYSTLKF